MDAKRQSSDCDEGKIKVVVARRPEPGEDTSSLREDVPHQGYLMALLCWIVLVYADGINPDRQAAATHRRALGGCDNPLKEELIFDTGLIGCVIYTVLVFGARPFVGMALMVAIAVLDET